MKKSILGLVAISIIVFSACAQQKKTTKTNVAAKGDQKKEKVVGIETLAMERTACFGTCPAYRVIINKNGQTTYISRFYTEYEGTYEKKLDQQKTTDLFQQFLNYKVDTCKDIYESLIQDLPGIMYEITYTDGKKKNISKAEFGPGFLKELGKKVDILTKVDDTWKKTAEPANKGK